MPGTAAFVALSLPELHQLADEWRQTIDYRFRKLHGYGPADPRYLDTYEIEMVLDVVADNRAKQEKLEQVEQTVAIRAHGPGQRTVEAQTDSRAIDAFLADEEAGGDGFARLAEAFPGIFGAGDDAGAGQPEGPPADLDPADVAALLGELGLAEEE